MFPYFITNKIIHPIRCRFIKWHKDIAFQSAKLSDTEWSSRDDLFSLQERKLKELCEIAHSGCTFYEKMFKDAGIEPDVVNLDSLSKLPIITKTTIRENFKGVLNRNYPEKEITQNATGGSSGEPFMFCQSRSSNIVSAALTQRGYNWCGMQQGLPFVKFWGAPTDVDRATTSIKSKIWSYLYNQKNIDAFNAGNKLFESEYLNFKRNPPFLLLSYSNILYEFALYIKKNNKNFLNIPAVVSSAGALYDFQRKSIQETISNNVFNRYGSREFGNTAQECAEHTGMHINMERFIIEIDNPDEGGTGDILVTDLENHAFPFIRYKIGDIGQITDKECPCGRKSVMFKKVIGRNLDIIRTPSGRIISGVMFPHFFKDFPDIILGQVIQDKIDHLEIRLKLQEGASLNNIEPLINKIKEATNNELKISVNTEEDFVINPTGKYRPVIFKIK